MSEQHKRQTKREKWAVNLAVNALSYARTLVVFLSLIAMAEREWFGLALSWTAFGVLTWALQRTLDTPSDETIRELSTMLAALQGEEAPHERDGAGGIGGP